MNQTNNYQNIEYSSSYEATYLDGYSFVQDQELLLEQVFNFSKSRGLDHLEELSGILARRPFDSYSLTRVQKSFVLVVERLVLLAELDIPFSFLTDKNLSLPERLNRLIAGCGIEEGSVSQVNYSRNQTEEGAEPRTRDCSRSKKAAENPLECRKVPPMSVLKYVSRHVDFVDVKDCHLICALIYIIRALETEKGLKLNKFSCHKLVSVSILLAQKYLIDDGFWNMSDYAAITGVKPKMLKEIEIFLAEEVLEWRFFVSYDDFVGLAASLLSIKVPEGY